MLSFLARDKLPMQISSGTMPVRKPPNSFPCSRSVPGISSGLSEPSSVFLNGFGGTTFNYETGLPQFSLGARSDWSPTAPTNC